MEPTAGSIQIERNDDGVAVIRMRHGENRFNPSFLDELEAALNELESSEGPLAVVLTGEGKFFSNGLDLDWLGQADDAGRRECLARIYEMFARLLEYPAPVVAAINGHAFGAGAMMSLACDWRLMREDRGFFCLPEIDIGLVFVPGMNGLITSKLSLAAARDSMLTGRRFGGPAAQTAGIVDMLAAEDRILEAAVEVVAPLAAKAGPVFGGIKRAMHLPAIEALVAEARTSREG